MVSVSRNAALLSGPDFSGQLDQRLWRLDFAGKSQVWEVLNESSVASRFEALRSRSTPLVGRDEEVELLLRRWSNAKSGEGRIVLISAEPGIGNFEPLPAAPSALGRLRSRPGPGATALAAVLLGRDRERLAGAGRGFQEVDVEYCGDVFAAPRPALPDLSRSQFRGRPRLDP